MPRDPRSFITVADTMPEHEKAEGLSDAAFRLLIESWCWCHRQNNDGAMSARAWERRGTLEARAELEAEGWVDRTRDGVQMHDYAEHQQTRDARSKLSSIRAEAGKQGGLARAAKMREKQAKQAADQGNRSNGVASATSNPKPAQAEVEERRGEVEEIQATDTLAALVPAAPAADPMLDEFLSFWQWYPRKVGRAPALKAYRAARRKVDRDIIAGAFRPFLDAMRNVDPDKVPHAATWLNREPWHDDPAALAPIPIRRDSNGIDWDDQLRRAQELDRVRGLA